MSPSSNGGSHNRWRLLLRWFQPGLGVKRWLALLVVGTALIGLGGALLLLDLYRANPESPWLGLLSLRALPRWVRAALFAASGVALFWFALVRLNRSLLAPYVRPGKALVNEVAEHRRRGRGPRIVALGGGTGQATLLRGLKGYSGNLTALVTVADDGGSSGRLRKSLGLPAPGDVRNCLAALSDDEDLLTHLFHYRFTEGEDLDGHSFGNLFIAALAGVSGSFDSGIEEAGRLLRVRGQVVPTTLSSVNLVADKTPVLDVHAVRVEGESNIPTLPGRIRRVHLEPNDAPAHPEAVRALLSAEMIVIGPGSLYTSVIPNLLLREIHEAVRASRAFKVYVCNVATQPGETDGYTVRDHVGAVEEHVGPGLFDVVLVNAGRPGPLPGKLEWVEPDAAGEISVPIHAADLAAREQPWRHDSPRLAQTLIALLEERTGPLDSLRPEARSSERNGRAPSPTED